MKWFVAICCVKHWKGAVKWLKWAHSCKHAPIKAWSHVINMNSPHTVHACVSIFLSIHQANCGQPQTALGCQLRRFSSRATRHPLLPNLSLFAVFSDLSISPFIFLQSSPHSSTSQLYIAWFLCPLISLHAFVLLFLCLPRLVSQSVPGGTVKTWMHLDIAGATFPAACVLHSALWHQTGHDPWPSTYDKWGCLSHARWCRWRWYWGDVGHSGI